MRDLKDQSCCVACMSLVMPSRTRYLHHPPVTGKVFFQHKIIIWNYYSSFKIFCHFWLAPIPQQIPLNQLVLPYLMVYYDIRTCTIDQPHFLAWLPSKTYMYNVIYIFEEYLQGITSIYILKPWWEIGQSLKKVYRKVSLLRTHIVH